MVKNVETTDGEEGDRKMTEDEKFDREFDLLREALEEILTKKLLAVYFTRRVGREGRKESWPHILELTVQMLDPVPNRTIKETAILLYAKGKLEEMARE